MAVALARSKAEATPSRTQAAAAVQVVQRTSSDSRRYGLSGRSIQPALRISAAHDPAEREAESVAARVTRGGISNAAPGLQRSPLLVQRQSPGAAGGVASPMVEARVRAAATGGSPLVPALRQTLEPRFRADFGGVRLHTDARAAALATAIGARAFTFGNHIFFNTGQYQPQTAEGLELLAHELTHTIQQSAVIQRAVIQRAVAPEVNVRVSPQIQGYGIQDLLDHFAQAANIIPGFRMLTIVIGTNPISGRAVERSAANILRAVVEFLPGGALITEALDRYGVFARVGGWIEGQLATLGLTGTVLKALLDQFLAGLSWTAIFNLGSVWDRAKGIFTSVVDRLLGFVRSLAGSVLGFIRDAILRPLAELASQTPAWDLLCAVLGRNPITGEAVPRNGDTLIGGFMKLIGQEEIWENIQRGNAKPRAWSWFQTALGGLMALVTVIPERFMATLRSLEVSDLVLPLRALTKVGTAFASFLGNFIAWAGGTIWDLLEIIFSVVAPEVIVYLKRAQSAFRTIIQNPMRFVGTLVSAVLTGFQQFASRFLTHLQAGIIGWLTGALGSTGVYIPQALSIPEILKFVLSLLGLTWANIRALLVRETSENVVVAMEQGFAIVRTLVIEGPAAAWQQIVEGLGNLRDMVIGQVMEFVKGQIVNIAVTRLMLLLNPAGAFVQAILAIWNTIQFLRERIRQIAQVAASVIDAIAEIAAGNKAPAANRVELTMAGLLPVVISFLARQVGLGNVGEAVTAFLERIRAPIRQGLTRVVRWIVTQARNLTSRAAGAVAGWWGNRRSARVGNRPAVLSFAGTGAAARLTVTMSPPVALTEFIANDPTVRALPAGDPNLRQVRDKANEIDTIKRGPSQGASVQDGQRISGLFTQIADLLPLLGVARPPRSRPLVPHAMKTVGSFQTAWKMDAPLLSIDPGGMAGSRPTQEPPLWRAVNVRAGTYIRGHLLNHHLFGPGNVGNLVPITGSLNTTMSARVEEPLKTAVLQQNKIIAYSVEADFSPRAPRQYVPAEQFLPTTMSFWAWELRPGPGTGDAIWANPERTPLLSNPLTLEHTLPADTPIGAVREQVNLSRDGVPKIVRSLAMNSAYEPYRHRLGIMVMQIVSARMERGNLFATYASLKSLSTLSGFTAFVDLLDADNFVALR
jgi:hypothetical protein